MYPLTLRRHAAATLMACAAASGAALADPMPPPGSMVRPDPVVGVWLGQVTQYLCDSGQVLAQFEGWQLIAHGGTYTTTGTAPPTSGSVGFGYWYRKKDGTYFEKHRFVRFAPDGSVDGFQVVTKISTLSADHRQKTSTIQSERLAPDGSLIFTACANETSTRFE